MDLEHLRFEHPTLTVQTGVIVDALRNWHTQVVAALGGSVWGHHLGFADRTNALAGHLEAVLVLANHGSHPSALALTRTALEHHLLDRLLLLADRYEETLRPEDPAVLDEWEKDSDERSEQWTTNVLTVERTRDRRGLRIVRVGHEVRRDSGDIAERVSPYWAAMQHYDAFVGHPDLQAATLGPFETLDSRQARARRNQALYSSYLRWSSICRNLELNALVPDPAWGVQLKVHYSFLSAFTHATDSGYRLQSGPQLGGPGTAHLLSELALLYAAAIAIGEVDTWCRYAADRPDLLSPPTATVTDAVDELRCTSSYFWFLGGQPQAFDRCQEANRLAHPLLLAGQRPTVRPENLANDVIGYYSDPMGRLRRLHTGEREVTTGFGSGPLWQTAPW